MSHTLDLVDDEQAWRPLSREEFRQLQRDDRLRDRGGREWRSEAPPTSIPKEGEYHAVLVSGA